MTWLGAARVAEAWACVEPRVRVVALGDIMDVVDISTWGPGCSAFAEAPSVCDQEGLVRCPVSGK